MSLQNNVTVRNVQQSQPGHGWLLKSSLVLAVLRQFGAQNTKHEGRTSRQKDSHSWFVSGTRNRTIEFGSFGKNVPRQEPLSSETLDPVPSTALRSPPYRIPSQRVGHPKTTPKYHEQMKQQHVGAFVAHSVASVGDIEDIYLLMPLWIR